jgi:uncharacterized membrane protein YhaH (DUF805 family)
MRFFTKNTINGLKNFRNFKGRASRKSHWFCALGLVTCFILSAFVGAAGFVGSTIFDPNTGAGGTLFIIVLSFASAFFWAFLLASYLASAVRRIHDSGKSGWFYLVPFYNVYLLVSKGNVESNKWGVPNS